MIPVIGFCMQNEMSWRVQCSTSMSCILHTRRPTTDVDTGYWFFFSSVFVAFVYHIYIQFLFIHFLPRFLNYSKTRFERMGKFHHTTSSLGYETKRIEYICQYAVCSMQCIEIQYRYSYAILVGFLNWTRQRFQCACAMCLKSTTNCTPRHK